MFIPYSVHAQLVERFIFNFRVRPDVLLSHLPVPSLLSQVIHGWSVVSFCLLKLDHVMLSPVPAWPGLKTISCAYRCGVVDSAGKPAVYVLKRYTDHALISRLGPLIFAGSMPEARALLTSAASVRDIHVQYKDHQCLFSALVQPCVRPDELNSDIFDSRTSFIHFIKSGVASYTPAASGNALARVDLQKEDTRYEALTATVKYSLLDDLWPDGELMFDSAVRATGGLYKWTYMGLIGKDKRVCL
ncbi:hypothetical protein KDA_65370 [Dictyobacter alpinus]|uniref:Acetoacetate decarboxylase n=1 Tax=Dictyobacter alpinus TaxID=2014873 RepID=A0A402BI58_9CHLR|nr:DUF2071 domain-containing protein [Dictyobacter alpinus]GCE31053.1 hypothetical protein KDA_65370 [Dictyobacter alpinus]